MDYDKTIPKVVNIKKKHVQEKVKRKKNITRHIGKRLTRKEDREHTRREKKGVLDSVSYFLLPQKYRTRTAHTQERRCGLP